MKNSIPMPQIKEERSLAYQLISFIFSVMLVIFFGSIIVTRVLYSRVMLDSQLDNMRHLVHERIYLIDGILEKVEALARTSQDLATNHRLDSAEFDRYLQNLLTDNSQIHSICLADQFKSKAAPRVMYTLRHRFHKREIKNMDYRYQDWFQIPYITGKAYWTEPWVDHEGKGEMVISYSLPLYESGLISGLLRFDIELKYLQGLITDRSYFKIGDSFLVSSTGTIVAHPDQRLVMNQSLFSLAQEYNQDALAKLGAAMTSGENGLVKIGSSSPFRDSWVYYQPLSSNLWSAGIAIDQTYLMQEINLILLIQTIAYIIMFLTISLLIYVRAMSVSRPLKALAEAADRIGSGDFNSQIPQSRSSHELATLSHSFTTMQTSLKEYINTLRITTEEKNKIRGDVIYASEIQTKLIPSNTAHPFGIRDIRAHGILEPAGDIGGDLYHYFLIDEDHFCFVVADVLGKGIVAAMAMTMVSTLLPSIAPFYKRSSAMLGELNNFLCRNNIESNFVTAFLGVLEISTGKLEYSNCGHVPLFIRKLDKSLHTYRETHSTALGVFENLDIGCDTIQLDIGDELILFTDGITEAMNVRDEFLGIKGLEKIVNNLRSTSPEDTAKNILNDVHNYARGSSHKDDITLLVLDYKHPGIGIND